MKKLIVTSALLIIVIFAHAQKVIEWPAFKGTTSNYVKILKIELQDTSTIIDFRVHFSPGRWIKVPKETYIQNSKGDEKLFVKSAKGIKIDEEHFTPENGVNDYTLYFPPVENNVETIDFIDPSWKIFDIELTPQEHFSIFPQSLLGNWLRTDGSNEWMYSFLEDAVIYDGDIWKQVMINKEDNIYQLLLQKEGKKHRLLIKQQDDKLLIGPDETKLEPFSRELISNPEYLIKNDDDFQLPVFEGDSAVYRGFIKGYVPEMGNTGMVYVNNIITQEQESYLITINADGTFFSGFPMYYPQPVLVKLFNSMENIYCQPGQTTFHFLDRSSYHDQGGPKNLFMGETATINNDLKALEYIRFFNYQDMQNKILDMPQEDYKTYIQKIENDELNEFEDFIQKNSVCKKATQIKQMQIKFSAWQNLISYNMFRESAYRTKNNVPRDQYKIPMESIELSPEFFDIVKPGDLNNPLAVVSGGDYYFLINRVKYADPVRSNYQTPKLNTEDIFKEFEARNITVDSKTQDMMKQLSECKTKEERDEILKTDSLLYHNFIEKYQADYREISLALFTQSREKMREEMFKKYFNLEHGFAMDIMNAQDISHKMKSSFMPLSEAEIEELPNKIHDKLICEYLLEKNTSLEKEIALKKEALKNKTGFVINETPKVNDGDLFDTIIKKYEGNVVFVDFWATWCGPCRAGMKSIKPLKEEMADKNIKFVYITNPSSPKETWEMMIPDIDGEHFYLNQDEWNVIAARFKVSGIPHYVLVDKNGKVVNEHVYFASSNFELKKLFEEYLK